MLGKNARNQRESRIVVDWNNREDVRAYRRKYYLEKEKGTEKFRLRCLKHGRAFYKRNEEKIMETQRRIRAECRDLVRIAKSRPCADCRQSFPTYVMDLHHVRGDKITHLGSGSLYNSRRLTIAEIAKCVVLCSNCHRIRTFGEKQEEAA